ncbi:hypothetical protein GWK47_033162 [Chionoecetes opilio]|uniref:Uncharacterized protein n=1 Tax=Chionoecetes opilio TaxID=41210 RepID=A0A8J5D3H2_CHIOP|nr:hypothetical protein GWK47_033162 [Chionoecetes opilio]
MAGDSHEDRGGGADCDGEGKVVETRSRHDSCGEEPPAPSHSPSFPGPGPSCPSARRPSLPEAPPAPPDSLAVPEAERPAERVPGPVPRDVVLPVGRLAPRPSPWYSPCPHRDPGFTGGPPCYVCSVLDLPPKYRRREARGWQRFRDKLKKFSQGTASPSAHDPPAVVFTISEWRPSDAPAAPPGYVPASLTPAPPHRAPQERDNPAFEPQDSVEGGGGRRTALAAPLQRPPAGVAFLPLPPLLPSFSREHMPPQLFPPPLLNHSGVPPFISAHDDLEEPPTAKCNRHLVCQLLYSLLLATASSTLLVQYDQPILIITSVIVFLALFVFLPIIALVECLFRCKMERDFRHYLHSVMTTMAPPPNTLVI